jgi:hypothetical protein
MSLKRRRQLSPKAGITDHPGPSAIFRERPRLPSVVSMIQFSHIADPVGLRASLPGFVVW